MVYDLDFTSLKLDEVYFSSFKLRGNQVGLVKGLS